MGRRDILTGSAVLWAPGTHGLCTTHKDRVNEELLNFIKS